MSLGISQVVEEFIRSPICRVRWAGWESDTLTLQRHGWNLAVDQAHMYAYNQLQLRLALKYHPESRQQGEERPLLHGYGSMAIDREMFHNASSGRIAMAEMLGRGGFEIGMMARDIATMRMGSSFSWDEFAPIDARPMKTTQRLMSEADIFRQVEKASAEREIIVSPDRVQEILDKVLAAQAPQQREIREKARKEAARDQFKESHRQIHANIISIA